MKNLFLNHFRLIINHNYLFVSLFIFCSYYHFLLKECPYKLNESSLNRNCKQNRRRYREQRLKEFLTTDDEVMSELKQGRYWTKEQRKEQFQKSKLYKQRNKSIQQYSTTEDFYLLNRIFLRENQQELKEKPYLAIKHQQQSTTDRSIKTSSIQKFKVLSFSEILKNAYCLIIPASVIILNFNY